MAIKKVEAIVLKRIPIRESSILATFFSRENGKFRGLIKGVRREKNPLGARFEPFTHLSVVYYEKIRSDTHLVSETVVLNANAYMRERLSLFGYGSYLTELVDVFFDLYDPYPDVFDLLQDSFKLLVDYPASIIFRTFEVKLFQTIGLLPILNHCVLCRKEWLDQCYFSPRQGGIICPSCDRGEPGTIKISQGTIQSLLYLLKTDIAQAVKLSLTPQSQKELAFIHHKFLQYRLEYPLKTPKFLAEIKPLLQTT